MVPVTPPWGDKGGVVFVFRVERYTIVAVPCVNNSVLFLLGTECTWWNNDWVWCVSLVAWRLMAWKSMVLGDFPVFLAQITMRCNHVTGSPIGTGSRTPNLTSLSRPILTSLCQWWGTGIGEWWAVGVPCGSIISLIGGPSMRGNVWCSQTLKVLDL